MDGSFFFPDLVPGVASPGTVISGGLETDQGLVSLSQMTSFYISSHLLQNFGQKQISFVRKRRKKILLIWRRGESWLLGSRGRVGMGLLSLWTWKGLLYPTMTLSPNYTLSTNLTPPAKMIGTWYRWLEPVKIRISTVNLSFFQGCMNIQQVGSLSLKNRGQRDASITKGVGWKFLQGFRFWRPSVKAG